MEIYFNTDLTLDALADRLREMLNIPGQNRSSYQREQRRVGANYGGDYYLFEAFGLELYLLRNGGEAAIPERSECPYYLFAAGANADHETVLCLTRQIFSVMQQAKMDVALDTLAA